MCVCVCVCTRQFQVSPSLAYEICNSQKHIREIRGLNPAGLFLESWADGCLAALQGECKQEEEEEAWKYEIQKQKQEMEAFNTWSVCTFVQLHQRTHKDKVIKT